MKYINLCLRAFVILWKEKTITRADRFCLWKKFLNLFACFIAFADKEKPKKQLKGAMISAVLSAVYDYETDWVRINSIENSIYLRLLNEHAYYSRAYKEAHYLFISDWKGELSEHGLERGSVALIFYDSLVKGEWMNDYTSEEISSNGRLLQIVDDLLDLKEDKEKGDTNCFLTEGKNQYLAEAKTFLKSDFFKSLQERCSVYYLIEFECFKVINQQEKILPKQSEVFRLLRPWTGLYAFVFTIVGFRFFNLPWFSTLFFGLTYAGITVSIMVWNDLIDRKRDVQKGKTLAFLYPYLVHSIWWVMTKIIIGLFIVCFLINWQATLLSFVVWFVAISYSVLKPKYPFNNMIVAFCSASPVLLGMAYAEVFKWKALLVFLIVFSTIIVMELVKDIQDMEGDVGYKHTLPTTRGKFIAVVTGIALCFFPIVGTMLYPHKMTVLSALIFIPIVFSLAFSIKNDKAVYLTERLGDLFISVLLITILIVQ